MSVVEAHRLRCRAWAKSVRRQDGARIELSTESRHLAVVSYQDTKKLWRECAVVLARAVAAGDVDFLRELADQMEQWKRFDGVTHPKQPLDYHFLAMVGPRAGVLRWTTHEIVAALKKHRDGRRIFGGRSSDCARRMDILPKKMRRGVMQIEPDAASVRKDARTKLPEKSS